MKKKVLVEGPILTQSGYGEHARLVLRSLRSQEEFFDIYAIPVGWGRTSWLFEDNEERKWVDSIINKTVVVLQQNPQFDIYVHVGIPNELKRKAPITIEVTAGIETTKAAPEWIDILNRECDKVITVSQHSKDVLEQTSWKAQDQFGRQFELKLNKPVEVIGYPVKEFNKFENPKDWLSLDYDFNFLCVAQWGPRKNLENTVRWFVEEFNNDKVGLVCKVNNANNSLLDREECDKRIKDILKSYPNHKCKVYLLHGDLNEDEVHNLYIHPQIKAILNFAHGEGFGLPLWEAAYCGLPVLAPDYSGHKDFLYMEVDGKKKSAFSKVAYDLKKIQQDVVWNGVLHPESEWAFVKPVAAKSAMRECYKDWGRFRGQSKKLKEYIEKNQVDVYHTMAETIYGEKIIKVDVSELPKISIIASMYDADEFIEGYLEDITSQTIFKEKCELILINANSPGNEEPVIKKYMEKYPNIIYKKLDEDPGIYATWNIAIKMASGEFITNANMDDRKFPNSIEKHAKSLLINKDIDLVYADSYIVNEPNKTWETLPNNCSRYDFEIFSPKAMLRGNLPHNNPMWRKSLHDKFGYFNENYKSASDWEFWLTCVVGNSKFMKLNDILGIYYFNPKGISTNFENFSWKQEEEEEIFMKFVDEINKKEIENNIVL
jgi:glycosyltransferase involved in cell wall biosynthesis